MTLNLNFALRAVQFCSVHVTTEGHCSNIADFDGVFLLQEILQRGIRLGALLEMSEEEVQSLLHRFNTAEEDITKLNTALRNLKIWTGKPLPTEKSLVTSGQSHHCKLVEFRFTQYLLFDISTTMLY